jgi:uncharacterized repeat protein (TIGR02543 family)
MAIKRFICLICLLFLVLTILPTNIQNSAYASSTKLVTNPYNSYSYSRLKKEINKLSEQYPDLIDSDYIGTTVGRRDIPLVRMGKGDRKILIIGSEHAREYVSTSVIMRSIDTYAHAYTRGTSIEGTGVRRVLDKVTFYFVPMLNIDGVQIVRGGASAKDKRIAKKYVGSRHYNRYKNSWKSNLRGVDLNRNYPFRWSAGGNTGKRGYMDFKGIKQASEPEIKAIISLCKENEFAFMLTIHTRGQIIFWKDKYNDVVPGASTLAKKVRSVTKYRLRPTSSMSSSWGESAKWFRFVYNKPALTVELSPTNIPYKKAVTENNFNNRIWNRTKALFLKTALTTKPRDKYKVFFSVGKGKLSKRYKNVITGKSYGKLPTPKRNGYKFRGWYSSSGSKISSKTVVTQEKNIKVYAKYRKK